MEYNLKRIGLKKQALETNRDDRLNKLETKIKDLMWWNEAKDVLYTPPVKEEEKTAAISDRRIYMLPDTQEEKTPVTSIKEAENTETTTLQHQMQHQQPKQHLQNPKQ